MEFDKIDIKFLIEKYTELLRFSDNKELKKQIRKKLKTLELRLKGFSKQKKPKKALLKQPKKTKVKSQSKP